ncbi:uncharacterized protein LOC130782401 [Actinidia eriantha]|uniref:uncharacterized protein LOC130782401 n=1 Tax=Actinidia eriantha TaxID=165200 RepID=UPI0025841D09|nr:uncharacterized protein LOC130782401 [Actinidia eriantha]
MTTSQNDTSKCFSAFLRRLLCSGSLPTHPSDLITEPNNFSLFDHHHPLKNSKIEVTKSQPPQTPGIVARLMGLDSLPDLNWAPKQRTLESILRSRSVNSAHYFPEFDLPRSNHRRVQTSMSFSEIPTSLQQENDDFVVLCCENVGLGNKSEMGLGETERKRGNLVERKFEKREKQENNKGCRREKNDDLFVVCFENVAGSNKSEMGLGELKKKKGKTERKCGRREVEGNMALLQQKNDDLFVLCFEKVGGSNKMRLTGSTCEMGFEESRETERNRGSFRERKFDVREHRGKNSSEVKVVDRKSMKNLKGKGVVKALNHKETCVKSEFGNKKKSGSRNRAKKVEPLCNLETPSHVPVVDLRNSLSHHETIPSGDSRSRATIPNSRKKPSTNNANSVNNSSNSTRNFVADDDSLVIIAKRNRDCKPKKTKEDSCEVVCEIFRLTEKETRESNWMGETVICFEDVEEICTQFGQQILDSLFHQVVDELVGCDMNLM